jgi:hypothetical protein
MGKIDSKYVKISKINTIILVSLIEKLKNCNIILKNAVYP